jgi:hypothetical protein
VGLLRIPNCHTMIETGILKNGREHAVVLLTDLTVEERGIHMNHSHVEVAIEDMIQADRLLMDMAT